MGMTDERGEESQEVLAEQRLSQGGLVVKLDRGFEQGTYAIYTEFDGLAERVGFGAAHRQAVAYCKLLKAQLGHFSDYSLARTEDASCDAGPGRKRDLELTYLTFALRTPDGCFHDAAMQDAFRLAVARAGQQWEQAQARAATQRHHSRRDAFRLRLRTLLAGDAYVQLDEATRERLLDEVSALAFPARGHAL